MCCLTCTSAHLSCSTTWLQKLKVNEAKEKAASEAAEKKTKQQQESVLKKRELERKKQEAAEAKAKKKEAERQAKEREKLRRARRGPGMAIMEAQGSHSEMCGPPPSLPGLSLCLARTLPTPPAAWRCADSLRVSGHAMC